MLRQSASRGVGRRVTLIMVILASGIVSAKALAQPAAAQTTSPTAKPQIQRQPLTQADLDLVKLLRAGGHAIVMRHTAADPNRGDTNPLNFKAIKTQQPLTDEGRTSARVLGEALRAIGVPIAEVLTSRFNRAAQTAVLAGFKSAKATLELTEGSLVTSPNEQRRRASALKQLAAAPLAPGTSRLLVTHRANITQAFGKEWYEVKEGEASVFRVENGAYALIARLQVSDWQRLVPAPQP